MNLSGLFIARPVATTLLTHGSRHPRLLQAAGLGAVTGRLPNHFCASPETVATCVGKPAGAPPRQDRRRDRNDSQRVSARPRIVLQFGLNRDIDGAARDVQAAINAAHADLPTSLKTNPTYWEVQSSRTFSKARGCAAARVGRACDSRCRKCPI